VIFDLGGGKQIVVRKGRIVLWANRGSLGLELTSEQQREIGLAMFQLGRSEVEKRGRSC
jgi:hypothetical protein